MLRKIKKGVLYVRPEGVRDAKITNLFYHAKFIDVEETYHAGDCNHMVVELSNLKMFHSFNIYNDCDHIVIRTFDRVCNCPGSDPGHGTKC